MIRFFCDLCEKECEERPRCSTTRLLPNRWVKERVETEITVDVQANNLPMMGRFPIHICNDCLKKIVDDVTKPKA